MNTLAGLMVFDWVVQTTWQAAVLAGLILLVQRFLGQRLSPQWRYGLWLLLVVRLLMPGLVGIAEEKARMKERLRAIARFGTSKTWRGLGLLVLVVIGTVALTDAMSSSPSSEFSRLHNTNDPAGLPATTNTNSQDRRFSLRMVDFDTQAPLSGVKVQMSLEYYSSHATNQELATDTDGLASIRFSITELKRLAYCTQKAGYLSLHGEWCKQQVGLLPETLDLKLSQGTEIGGIVMDNHGQPLAGAEVFFDRPMNMLLVYDHQVASQVWSAPAGERLATTDATGAWKARGIWPTVQWAALRVRHRGYADATYSTETTKAMEAEGKGHALRFEDLTAKHARFTLAPGLTVQGKVLDPTGKPKAGVVVRYADHASENPNTDSVMGQGTVTTDASGKFQVDDLPAQHIFFSVQASDYAPAVGELDLDSNHREIELRLADGQELSGTVVDQNGEPISGAQITLQDWSIWRGVRWSTVTDDRGRFNWDNAPVEKFLIAIEKDAFLPQRKILQAGRPQQIRLNPVLKLSGKVTDAKSGQPVPRFRVFWADGEDRLTHNRIHFIDGTNGQYFLDLGRLHVASRENGYCGVFIFRVEAEGYVATNSKPFESRNGDVGQMDYDIEMEPAKMMTGTVVDPAGQPIPGAQLALKTPTARLRLAGKPQFEDLDQQPFHMSDGAGKFQMGMDPAATHLLAVHPKGFARVDLKTLTNLAIVHLEPWGKIEGSVWQYDQPLAKEKVELGRWRNENERSDVPGSFDPIHMETTSDAAGHYQFNFVPPGKGSIYRGIQMRQGASSGAPEFVRVKAGETSVVKVGGEGRPIIGRFKVKNPYVPIDWQKDHHAISSAMPRPPENLKSKEEREAWLKQPEIQRAFDTARNYPILFAADGSFRIDEVLPGQYQFWIQIYDPTEPDAMAHSRYIANFNGSLEVPESPDQNSLKPFDVGNFELTLKPKIEPGQTTAPQFTVLDLVGKPFKLADFRGKYVVLDFWATWCGPCLGEIPYLKQAYDRFKNRQDFAMISLSLDKSVAEPRAFVEKNGLNWKQGYLGPREKDDVPNRYGVEGIPALFLIGPDGKILAKDIEGHALIATLQKHLF